MKIIKMLRSIGELIGDREYELDDHRADSLAHDHSAIILRVVVEQPKPVIIKAEPKPAHIEEFAKIEPKIPHERAPKAGTEKK